MSGSSEPTPISSRTAATGGKLAFAAVDQHQVRRLGELFVAFLEAFEAALDHLFHTSEVVRPFDAFLFLKRRYSPLAGRPP